MNMITKIVKESKEESRRYFHQRCQQKIERFERKKMRKKEYRCPRCGSEGRHRKRGKRERRLQTSMGEIQFKIQQVECCNCGRVYRPLGEWLGLRPRERITEELLEKAIKVAIHTSYRVASETTKEFTDEKVSGRRIQKAIIKEAEKIKKEQKEAPPEEYAIMLKDSTKANTGKTKRGEDINIVYGIKGKVVKVNKETGEIKRSWLIGDILQVAVGKDRTLCSIQHRTGNVMTDGDAAIKKVAKKMRMKGEVILHRCNWHLSRMLGFALYHDGLRTKAERKTYVRALASIIKYSHNNYRKYYRQLIEECGNKGYQKAVTYLKNAEYEFYNTKQNAVRLETRLMDGTKVEPTTLLANSPVERVMREVNRRADIGVRWSSKGLEAMTTTRLHFLYQNKSTFRSMLNSPQICYV